MSAQTQYIETYLSSIITGINNGYYKPIFEKIPNISDRLDSIHLETEQLYYKAQKIEQIKKKLLDKAEKGIYMYYILEYLFFFDIDLISNEELKASIDKLQLEVSDYDNRIATLTGTCECLKKEVDQICLEEKPDSTLLTSTTAQDLIAKHTREITNISGEKIALDNQLKELDAQVKSLRDIVFKDVKKLKKGELPVESKDEIDRNKYKWNNEIISIFKKLYKFKDIQVAGGDMKFFWENGYTLTVKYDKDGHAASSIKIVPNDNYLNMLLETVAYTDQLGILLSEINYYFIQLDIIHEEIQNLEEQFGISISVTNNCILDINFHNLFTCKLSLPSCYPNNTLELNILNITPLSDLFKQEDLKSKYMKEKYYNLKDLLTSFETLEELRENP
ncbi:hypothetical protein WA158_002255 [Blastocystis sp. Blastoise]